MRRGNVSEVTVFASEVPPAYLHVDGGHEPPHLRMENLHVPEPRVVGRVAEVDRGVGAGYIAETGQGGGRDVGSVVIEPHHPTGVELLHQAKVLPETDTREVTYVIYSVPRSIILARFHKFIGSSSVCMNGYTQVWFRVSSFFQKKLISNKLLPRKKLVRSNIPMKWIPDWAPVVQGSFKNVGKPGRLIREREIEREAAFRPCSSVLT